MYQEVNFSIKISQIILLTGISLFPEFADQSIVLILRFVLELAIVMYTVYYLRIEVVCYQQGLWW